MKTILKIIVVILLAYGVYRLIDKQWAQDLRNRIQEVFQSQEALQEDENKQAEIPEITIPEQSASIASENTLVLDYIFEWTESVWQTTTGAQESNTEIVTEPTSEIQDTNQNFSSVNTSSSQWLTAQDYRDLEKLWQNLVE